MRTAGRIILTVAIALLASGCNQNDKLKVQQLEEELSALKEQQLPGVSDALDITEPETGSFCFEFDKTKYGIDAGSSVSVAYSLQSDATVEIITSGGWSATVESTDGRNGHIVVTCPDPAVQGSIVARATTSDGRTTAATVPLMIRDPFSDVTRTDIRALAYNGFDDNLATDENFRKLVEAGFNMLTVEQYHNWRRQLVLAEKYGIQVVLFVNGIAGNYWLYGTTELDDVVNEAKNYPALAAYQIADEWSVNEIPQLAYEKNHIEELDPEHPVYINLNPGSSQFPLLRYGTETYEEYVERYAADCNLDFITFDQYPVFQGYIDPTWYMTITIVSETAKRHNIPFWAFTLCCREWYREDPTLENIRLQCNTNLAYGAQVNQYFVYCATSGTDYAPIMCDGRYTTAYDTCREYNIEMHNRGFVFAGCDVKKIRSFGFCDGWVKMLLQSDLPHQINCLSVDQEALVSFVENAGNEYLVVVNSLWNKSQTLKLGIEEMVYAIDHDGVFTELQPGMAEFELEGGDMMVIKYK